MAKQQTKAQLEKELKSLQGLHEEAHDERVRLRRELKDALGELDSAKRNLTAANVQIRETREAHSKTMSVKATLEARVRELESTIGSDCEDLSVLKGQIKALSAVLDDIRNKLDIE